MNMNKTVIRFLIVCILIFISERTSFSQSPIPKGAVLETVATGFQQPEGPVWKDGVGLLFSDIQRSTIYRWSKTDSIMTYLHPSDSSNGLTFDRQGRLILTQMLSRRVARQELNGNITPLASTYNGKKFNSPNDVVVKSDGSIFFTDPDFNTPGGSKNKELTFQGIYRISPAGTLSLLDSSLNKPNGICFSLDEKKLYVDESAKDSIYVWDVVNDSILANKKPFYAIPMSGYCDGMKIDTAGNIYCTAPTGVWIISPAGKLLGKIATPVTPSNCNWGDADRNTLYITAGKSLYRVRMVATGIEEDPVRSSPGKFELLQNYPNPFNPTTTLQYDIPSKSHVIMNVFDLLGREVATVLDDVIQAGTHTITFDGLRIASGVYFLRLIASPINHDMQFIQTRKIVLLK